jgi:beta-galactosidase
VTITSEVNTTGPTAGPPVCGRRLGIYTSRNDIAHVTVSVSDAKGSILPTADDQMIFTLTGQGRVIGVDNRSLSSHESTRP